MLVNCLLGNSPLPNYLLECTMSNERHKCGEVYSYECTQTKQELVYYQFCAFTLTNSPFKMECVLNPWNEIYSAGSIIPASFNLPINESFPLKQKI